MKLCRFARTLAVVGAGAMLLQAGGCVGFNDFFQFVDTVFLGITAAGAIAIIQNV